MFDRGRWSLPAAALSALVFPTLIFTALNRDGGVNPADESMLLMHVLMVQMNIFMFSAALIAVQSKVSRLYAYPASTATLVTWTLLPAMAAMWVETVLWTMALNALFDLDWPIWGPAWLAAVALAAVVAGFWLTERSGWVVFALVVVGSVVGLWFKSRYGGMFSGPLRLWDVVTVTDALVMLSLAAFSFWIAIVAVARNRRGEPPLAIGIVAWLTRLLDRAPTKAVAFRTPGQAQFWYQWRNGRMMPALVVSALIVGLVVWLFSSRDPQELFTGLLVGSQFIMCVAIVGGLMMGNVDSSGNLEMGQFLATRPMTTADMSRTMLRAAARSLLLAWAIWIAAVLLTSGLLATFGALPDPLLSDDLDWRALPAAFLGSWILMGGLAAMAMMGRSQLLSKLFIGFFAAFIGLTIFATFALSPEAHDWLMRGLATAIGLSCMAGTAWMFVASRRASLVDAPAAWAALTVWAALVVISVLLIPASAESPWAIYAVLCGAAALTVAPLAAGPLALAWNRHR